MNKILFARYRALLMQAIDWEYPVFTNGMLKITQAHSATKNNYVLEVG